MNHIYWITVIGMSCFAPIWVAVFKLQKDLSSTHFSLANSIESSVQNISVSFNKLKETLRSFNNTQLSHGNLIDILKADIEALKKEIETLKSSVNKEVDGQ